MASFFDIITWVIRDGGEKSGRAKRNKDDMHRRPCAEGSSIKENRKSSGL
jgi:hypothetical protein